MIAIPGINLVAYGPIVAAFTGAGVGAALSGIIGSTMPEYEAKVCEDNIKKTSVLIAVDATSDERENAAKNIWSANSFVYSLSANSLLLHYISEITAFCAFVI
jgi:hypothetical protein